MTRLDPAFLPSWLMAVMAVAFLGLLGAWAQSAHVPNETFPDEYEAPLAATDEPEQVAEAEDEIADFAHLGTLRLPRETLGIGALPDNVPDEARRMLESHFGGNKEAFHLIGLEQHGDELLAVIFNSEETKTHFVKQGGEVGGHIVSLIDRNGVTLQIVGTDTTTRLTLKKEEEGST